MCLGVPGMIVEREDQAEPMAFGLVEFAGLRRRVCLACVPEAVPGEYVIVHAGIAISRIDTQEAERVLEHLREMGENDGWDTSRDSKESLP
jgi:hydrogenase expression/formation protein HypC